MLFPSLHFLWFFVAVYALYWALQPRRRAQNGLLLLASWFFYGYWDWRFLGLLIGSTIVDFLCGLAFDRPGLSARGRRLVLAVSVAVNLGALSTFKYLGFFVDSARELVAALGFDPGAWHLSIVLPVGISFYTFQTLSYSIDRYRGALEVEGDFVDFALFVSFFPQLVAGPIVRASWFLPQGKGRRAFRWDDQADGVQLVLWGLFKKAVIADNLAPFVDGVFGAEAVPGMAVRLLAVYAFCAQIYCDFSGYTDIARGLARMLGFDFPLNFRQPYLSSDPSTFWRRWHISLSTWLRDYLYVTLGGNRRGLRRTYVNLMATMVLGGLWHGAAWNFVLWGAYQGTLLAVHRFWRERVAPPNETPALWMRLVRWLVFFQLVNLGWLLFRAQSLEQIAAFLTPGGGWLTGLELSEHTARGLLIGGLGCVALLLWDAVLEREGRDLPTRGLSAAPRALLFGALYLAVSLLGRFAGEEFIYFQF
ncbi:MAG: MBOAT family protein [Planctomycetota bacterium]